MCIRDSDSTDSPEGLHIVFLLGGAGNGKSFVARSLGKELGLSAPASDALAHRIYKTTKNGVHVELLNDATIAPREDYQSSQPVALASDIQRWWNESAVNPVAAFCCVNRGIVIDELRSLAEHNHGIEVLAHTVLAWLASPEQDVGGQLGASREEAKLVPVSYTHLDVYKRQMPSIKKPPGEPTLQRKGEDQPPASPGPIRFPKRTGIGDRAPG